MLKAIHGKWELIKLRTKTHEKLETKKNSLENIQNGKIGLSQRLSTKTNTEQIFKLDKKVQDLIKELETIKIIEDIVTIRLIKVYLPSFKQSKHNKFEQTLTNFLKSNQKSMDLLLFQSTEISEKYSK